MSLRASLPKASTEAPWPGPEKSRILHLPTESELSKYDNSNVICPWQQRKTQDVHFFGRTLYSKELEERTSLAEYFQAGFALLRAG